MVDNTPSLTDFARRMRSLVEEQLRLRRKLNLLCLAAWERGELGKTWDALSDGNSETRLHYFLQARPTGDIKIGKTNQIARRFRDIFCNNSRGVDLIACYPAPKDHESELLDEFRPHRLCGEWHEQSEDLVGYLRLIGSEPRPITYTPPAVRRLDSGRRYWA